MVRAAAGRVSRRCVVLLRGKDALLSLAEESELLAVEGALPLDSLDIVGELDDELELNAEELLELDGLDSVDELLELEELESEDEDDDSLLMSVGMVPSFGY